VMGQQGLIRTSKSQLRFVWPAAGFDRHRVRKGRCACKAGCLNLSLFLDQVLPVP
jgi:hypothetical protein